MKSIKTLLFSAVFVCALSMLNISPANAANSQTFHVTWSAPTTRADGSALSLSDLAGYEIYYTIDSQTTASVVAVSSGGILSKDITLNLPPQTAPYTIYFAMTAIDNNNLKSALSPVVTVKVTSQFALPAPPTNLKLSINCVSGSCSMIVQ